MAFPLDLFCPWVPVHPLKLAARLGSWELFSHVAFGGTLSMGPWVHPLALQEGLDEKIGNHVRAPDIQEHLTWRDHPGPRGTAPSPLSPHAVFSSLTCCDSNIIVI